MKQHVAGSLDRVLAKVCLNCPVCRQARKKQKGLLFTLVNRVESHLCPFCRAFEWVYGQKAHKPLSELKLH